MQRRLGHRLRALELGGERLLGRRLGGEPGRGRLAVAAPDPRRPAGGELAGVGAQDRRRAPARLVPAAGRVDHDLVGSGGRDPGPQRLARRHLAETQDQVGPDALGEALVPEQEVVGGDHMRAVVRPAAQLRGGLGEQREARRLGEASERLPQLRVELAAGDDHPGSGLVDVLRDLVEQEGRGLRLVPGDGGQRSLAAALERQRVGRRHRSVDRRPAPAALARGG